MKAQPIIAAVLSSAWVLLAAGSLSAQRTPEGPAQPMLVAALGETPSLSAPGYVIRSDVREVRIDLRVKDGQGRPVTGLAPADLHVFDSQRRVQRLSSLRAEFDLPLTVAVLIDTSGSTARVLGEEKRAALDFLRAVMRPGDHALVAGFANHLGAVESADVGSDVMRSQIEGMQTGGQTGLFDAISELCSSHLRQERGALRRRVLIILSDGADNYSMHGLDDAIEAAMKFEVTVFSVTLGKNTNALQRGALNLRYLSKTTGGDSLFVASIAELATTLQCIDRELRSYFVLTYPAPAAESGEDFHPVRITSGREGWQVQAKVGYFMGGAN